MMRRLFSFLILSYLLTACHPKLYKGLPADHFDFSYEWDNYVKKSPITNREFLIFLAWHLEIYGEYSPNYVESFLPWKVEADNKSISENPAYFFDPKWSDIAGYILNPDFLDYPVTGLSEEILVQFYKWMHDRYNENVLIEIKALAWNVEQKDDDSFNSEAHLLDQYLGVSIIREPVKWRAQILIPLLRPPFEQREISIDSRNEIWRKYRLSQKSSLKRWVHYYFKENGLYALPAILDAKEKTIISNKYINEQLALRKSIYVINEAAYYKGAEYLSQVPVPEKDRYGALPFKIIGQNTLNNEPIIKSIRTFKSEQDSEKSFYYLVLERDTDTSNWPKTSDQKK